LSGTGADRGARPPPILARPPRILLVRLSALGDIVHALPVADALRRAWPEARLDWLVDARYRPLLDLADGLDGVEAWASPAVLGPQGLAAVVRRLRATAYDVALDLQGLLKSAVLARLSGAARVVGFGHAHLREPAARWCYTETVEPEDAGHVVEKNLAMLRALDLPAGAAGPRFALRASPTTVSGEVEAEVRRLGASGCAVLNPGANWPNKRWPPARFGALARELRQRHGWASCVLWGPSEEVLAREVAAASGGCAFIAPRTDLADVLAVAGGARVVVSGDTGPMHLAAARGTPVVGLFGPTSSTRNGPWGMPADAQVSRFKGCSCHYQRRCSQARRCIDTIEVADVLAAIDTTLARASLGSTREER
jgi:lipopolysaccharide heptosyltransferase I